jgi:uncharacterized protein (DUF58 family)
VDPERDPGRGAGAALKARRTLTPTRAGWVFFAFTLGVGFAALNTGNNLLYLVFALMLAFLVLSGVLSESALRGIEVSRRLPRELYAGAPNGVRLELRNVLTRVGAFAIVVEDRVFGAAEANGEREARTAGRVFTLRVGAGERVPCRYEFTPACRGPIDFAPIRISTRFPFGLFVKSRVVDLGGHALAYPALQDERPEASHREATREGETQSFGNANGSNVSGVREVQPGDPMRRVHWKSSLRRGALFVLQQDDERDAEVDVELITRTQTAGDGQGGSGFEWRVSRAATEVVACLDAGLRVGLHTEGERFEAAAGTRQRERLLAFLAHVEAQERAA